MEVIMILILTLVYYDWLQLTYKAISLTLDYRTQMFTCAIFVVACLLTYDLAEPTFFQSPSLPRTIHLSFHHPYPYLLGPPCSTHSRNH